MKIFFTASFHGKKQYQRYYNIVLKTLEQIPNAFITSTEKDNYLSVLPLKDRKRIKNKEKLHYLAIKRNIQDVVDNFIEVVKKNQFSERFNCFISPSQMDYVKEKAKKEHMNASEYIRSLIDDDKIS